MQTPGQSIAGCRRGLGAISEWTNEKRFVFII